MNVRSPKYNAHGTIDCEIEHSQYGWIPFTASPGDSEEQGRMIYAEIMAGQHGEIAPYVNPDLPTPVPQSVTMRQARRAMLQAGILDQVEAMIAAMPGDEGRAARIDWEYALEVRRDWPLIAALSPQMGLTDQHVDDLFIAAASIPQ